MGDLWEDPRRKYVAEKLIDRLIAFTGKVRDLAALVVGRSSAPHALAMRTQLQALSIREMSRSKFPHISPNAHEFSTDLGIRLNWCKTIRAIGATIKPEKMIVRSTKVAGLDAIITKGARPREKHTAYATHRQDRAIFRDAPRCEVCGGTRPSSRTADNAAKAFNTASIAL